MSNARTRKAKSIRQPRSISVEAAIKPRRRSGTHRTASKLAMANAVAPALLAASPAGQAPTRKSPAAKRKKKARKPAQRLRQVVTRPRGQPIATAPVIALPDLSEPLTTTQPTAEPGIDLATWSALATSPPALAARPSAGALVRYRSGGLLDALAVWLGGHTQQVLRRLGGLGRPDKFRPQRWRLGTMAQRAPHPQSELLRLRAENERLRLQLETLLVLQSGAAFRSSVPQT